MSNNTVQYLSDFFVRIHKELEKIDYSSADPIVQELNVSSAQEAIQFFSTELEKYKTKNFHPLSAQITRILAILNRIEGNYAKWFQMTLNCLSPNYQHYLPSNIQDDLQKYLAEYHNLHAALDDSPFSPFEAAAWFNHDVVLPSESIKLNVTVKSKLLSPIKATKVYLTLTNEMDNDTDFDIFGEIELKPSTLSKCTIDIPPQIPGKFKIKKVHIVLMDSIVSISTRSNHGISSIEVLPYKDDLHFIAETNSFPITRFPYKITAKCSGFPSGTTNVSLHAAITGDAKFENGQESLDFSQQNPTSEVVFQLPVVAQIKCDVQVQLDWKCNFSEEISYSETKDIHFYEPFSISNKVFGPSFTAFSLKNPPSIYRGTQYTFLTIFEYSLTNNAKIHKIEVIPQDGYSISQMPIDLPISLSQSEAISHASFVTCDGKAKPGSPGSLSVTFSVEDNNEMIVYNTDLPEIQFASCEIDCFLTIPDCKKDQESEMKVSISNNPVFGLKVDSYLNVTDNDFFTINDESKKQFVNLEEKELEIKIKFTPKDSGTRSFPKISIVSIDGVELWTSAPFVYSL